MRKLRPDLSYALMLVAFVIGLVLNAIGHPLLALLIYSAVTGTAMGRGLVAESELHELRCIGCLASAYIKVADEELGEDEAKRRVAIVLRLEHSDHPGVEA